MDHILANRAAQMGLRVPSENTKRRMALGFSEQKCMHIAMGAAMGSDWGLHVYMVDAWCRLSMGSSDPRWALGMEIKWGCSEGTRGARGGGSGFVRWLYFSSS